MKTNKFNFLAMLLMVAAIAVVSCSKDNQPVIEEPVIEEPNEEEGVIALSDASGGRLVVLGWYGVPFAKRSQANFKTMADCGFTHNIPGDWYDQYAGAWPEGDATGIDFNSVLDMLDKSQAGGIKSFVPRESLHPWHYYHYDNNNDGVYETVTPDPFPLSVAYIETLVSHPALAGFKIKDEPGGTSADFNNTINDAMRTWFAPRTQKTGYVNLLPVGAVIVEGGSYRDAYVKRYFQEPTLHQLSFTGYPIIIREGSSRREVQSQMLFESLEAFSSVSKELSNKPFWTFALATTHNNYPVPTLSDLRYQVYNSLAYGSQGVQYFTYWEVSGEGEDQNVVGKQAIVDINGNPSPIYNVVKLMNREIEVVSPVFLGAVVEKVQHTALPDGTTSCSLFDKSKDLPAVITDLTIGGNSETQALVISQLKKGNDRFFVIVNRDINSPVQVKVTGTDALHRVIKDDVEKAQVVRNNNESTHTLAVGDALIYFWKNEE